MFYSFPPDLHVCARIQECLIHTNAEPQRFRLVKFSLNLVAVSYSLICSLLSFPLTDFLCKWIAYVNAACSGFIAQPQQCAPVTYDKQEAKTANLNTLKSFFFREPISESLSRFLFLLSSLPFLLHYIASPCIPSFPLVLLSFRFVALFLPSSSIL